MARRSKPSGADELDVAPRRCGEGFEIIGVGADDSISVRGEKYERGGLHFDAARRNLALVRSAPR